MTKVPWLLLKTAEAPGTVTGYYLSHEQIARALELDVACATAVFQNLVGIVEDIAKGSGK